MTNDERRQLTQDIPHLCDEISEICHRKLEWNDYDSKDFDIEFRAYMFKNHNIPVEISIGATIPDNERDKLTDSFLIVRVLVDGETADQFRSNLDLEDRDIRYAFAMSMGRCMGYAQDMLS